MPKYIKQDKQQMRASEFLLLEYIDFSPQKFVLRN